MPENPSPAARCGACGIVSSSWSRVEWLRSIRSWGKHGPRRSSVCRRAEASGGRGSHDRRGRSAADLALVRVALERGRFDARDPAGPWPERHARRAVGPSAREGQVRTRPADGADLAPPHPGREDELRAHGIKVAALESRRFVEPGVETAERPGPGAPAGAPVAIVVVAAT